MARHLRENGEKNKLVLVFSIICFIIMLIPSVGMLLPKFKMYSDSAQSVETPSTVKDGKPNIKILSDSGAYFEQNFGLRAPIIDFSSRIYSDCLHSPLNDNVVKGSGGWEFYARELPDYLGRKIYSDEQIEKIASNLKKMQDYSEKCGAKFLFMIGPNKSSMLSEHMPYYYKHAEEVNIQKIYAALDACGVNYINTQQILSGDAEDLFFKCDSHWNDKGAAIVYEKSLENLEINNLIKPHEEMSKKINFIGDIEKMNHPAFPSAETNWYQVGINDGTGESKGERSGIFWRYSKGESVADDIVSTTSDMPGAEGSLYMYRDSFSNNLIPFYSTAFKTSTFSKMVPYDCGKIKEMKPDCVIVERAMRNLDFLAEKDFIY